MALDNLARLGYYIGVSDESTHFLRRVAVDGFDDFDTQVQSDELMYWDDFNRDFWETYESAEEPIDCEVVS